MRHAGPDLSLQFVAQSQATKNHLECRRKEKKVGEKVEGGLQDT